MSVDEVMLLDQGEECTVKDRIKVIVAWWWLYVCGCERVKPRARSSNACADEMLTNALRSL